MATETRLNLLEKTVIATSEDLPGVTTDDIIYLDGAIKAAGFEDEDPFKMTSTGSNEAVYDYVFLYKSSNNTNESVRLVGKRIGHPEYSIELYLKCTLSKYMGIMHQISRNETLKPLTDLLEE